jgi:plastocyanin
MRPIARGIATLATALALAACSGGASQPPTQASGTQGPAAGTAAATPGATTATTQVCVDSTDPTTVNAAVGGFQWGPVSAKVGDVITWTNADAQPHRVGLDDGSCSMSGSIPGGGSASLVFSMAGTYPFRCLIHSSMKGTITITQ